MGKNPPITQLLHLKGVLIIAFNLLHEHDLPVSDGWLDVLQHEQVQRAEQDHAALATTLSLSSGVLLLLMGLALLLLALPFESTLMTFVLRCVSRKQSHHEEAFSLFNQDTEHE